MTGRVGAGHIRHLDTIMLRAQHEQARVDVEYHTVFDSDNMAEL